MTFPYDFVWGAATSSYQIEGWTQGVDGGAESVWDLCCRRKGFVLNGDTGFMACDHYRRCLEDIALMQDIGLQAYRFSIMWPRVMPQGTGPVNEAGIAFYDRLIDGLLEAGIEPWVTLFHWDYPVALFERGGWVHEDSPTWFEDYTRVIVDRFSDRVRHWFTLNEPACFIGLGLQEGIHAPGLKLPLKLVTMAYHNALLAHGRAVRVIRSESKSKDPKVGYAPCFKNCVPVTGFPADIEAARRHMFTATEKSMFETAWNLDPVFKGRYPEDMMQLLGDDAPAIKNGDMELIAQPLDFLGANLYVAQGVRADEHGDPVMVDHEPGFRTALDWPVTPGILRWSTKFLHERYGVPIIVTENGIALHDQPDANGIIRDPARIDFLNQHLSGLRTSISEGIPVLGYFHWSLMDNFEWAYGYHPRFGLIHIDYQTQKRTIKESGVYYRDIIQQQGRNMPAFG